MNLSKNGILDATHISEVGIVDGLVGWWKLDGDTRDYTQYNNHGANNGAVVSGGLDQMAYSFDGIDDYIKIDKQVVDSPEGLTISSWIYPIAGGSNYRCALHSGSDSSVGSSCYWLGISGSNHLTATIGARDGVGWSGGMTSVAVIYEKWTLLTATWDGTTAKVYVDGQFQKSYGLSTYSSLDTHTRIGASSDGANYQYSGKIQDVRIYNRVLMPEEIKIMYKIGSGEKNIVETKDTIYLRGSIKEGY